MQVTLDEMKPKQRGVIAKITGGGHVNRRIAEMGVVAGTPIEVKRVAPLGDPIDVIVKGYHLSLRKEEARNITVDVQQS